MVKIDFKPGDYVVLRLAKREVEGRIVESYDKEVVLLKLKSGYNVGIAKENILDAKVLEKHKEEEVKSLLEPGKIKESRNVGTTKKKKIGMVITGGTIAAKLDPRTGGVNWLTDVEEFKRFYPELFELVEVKKIEVPFMIASESMTSENWIKIANSVEKMLNDSEIEGVIVTHGTDFLHYTSSALSFFLKDLNKPVVLTYSQRSIDRASSDASLNLQCAVHMALSDCAEVMLVGHASINDDFCFALQGNKVRKMHTSRRDAFKAINTGELAKVYKDGKIEFLREYRARNKETAKVDSSFDNKVALVKFYPGQKPEILDYYSNEKYKGLVIEVSGLGHVSVEKNSWVPKLKKFIKQGGVVCAAAQTVYGRLDPYVYSNGRELVDAGVIFLEDMLAETALVKLGFVLGHRNWRTKEKVREKMLENFNGEFEELISE